VNRYPKEIRQYLSSSYLIQRVLVLITLCTLVLTVYFFNLAGEARSRIAELEQIEQVMEPQPVQTQKQPLHKMSMPATVPQKSEMPQPTVSKPLEATVEPVENIIEAVEPEVVVTPLAESAAEQIVRQLNFVEIPAGEFTFGSSTGDIDERDVKQISVASFSMASTEVTRGQFAAFVADTGYISSAESKDETVPGCYSYNADGAFSQRQNGSWQDLGFAQTDDHPVSCVSIKDALAFIDWLNKNDTRVSYRLPTEIEWEYAAKAQSGARWHWGNNAANQCGFANGADLSLADLFAKRTHVQCDDGFQFTAPVASFKANRFGLFDMGGNVWEWTSSCYTHADYKSKQPWPDQICAYHVLKGGSFINPPRMLRHANKDKAIPTHRLVDDGFRLAFSHR